MIAELADGRRLEFPDGTDPAVVQATVKRMMSSGESPTSGRNLLGAALEPGAAMLTGSLATPLAGLAGLGTTLTNAVGLSDKDPASTVSDIQKALTYQPRTEGGQTGMIPFSTAAEYLGKASRFAGEKVQDFTGNPALAATVDTTIQALPGALGVRPGGLPAIAKGSGDLSRWLMVKALRPSVDELKSGAGARAAQTMLDEGVNVGKGGVRKLDKRISDVNDAITDAVSDSSATINRADVAKRLDDVRAKVGTQVTPEADLAAVEAAAKEFGNQPSILPAQYAQALKQGTYRNLKDKYGEMGSASVEAQKALARGLKEELSAAIPEVAPLNDRVSALIEAQKMAEHRALMEGNKNLSGLAPIAPTSVGAAVTLADRSAWLKSVIAQLLNPGKGMGATDAALVGATAPQSFTEDMRRREAMLAQILRQGQEQ